MCIGHSLRQNFKGLHYKCGGKLCFKILLFSCITSRYHSLFLPVIFDIHFRTLLIRIYAELKWKNTYHPSTIFRSVTLSFRSKYWYQNLPSDPPSKGISDPPSEGINDKNLSALNIYTKSYEFTIWLNNKLRWNVYYSILNCGLIIMYECKDLCHIYL